MDSTLRRKVYTYFIDNEIIFRWDIISDIWDHMLNILEENDEKLPYKLNFISSCCSFSE